MESSELDNFMALNEELAALSAADVILNLGLEPRANGPATDLERINAAVARQVSRGSTLDEALHDGSQSMPVAYRCMMMMGLRSGDLTAELDRFSSTATSNDDTRYIVRASFLYPLLICCMVYVGLVGFCIYLVPTLASMQESLWVAPGRGLSTLMWLRATLPYWVAIPPLILVFFLTRRWWTRSRRPRGLPGIDRLFGVSLASSRRQLADFAEMLAELLDLGTPLDDSLVIAAGASGNNALLETARAEGSVSQDDPKESSETRFAEELPPLLHWALFSTEAAGQRTNALRAVANVYREEAESRTHRLELVAPRLICIVVGGGAVLLYGLALFFPVVELLKSIGS